MQVKYLIFIYLMSFFTIADDDLASAVTVYDQINFEGNAFSFSEDISSLPDEINDKMKSFQIKPGYEVTFYERANYQGYSFEKHSTSPDAAKFSKAQAGISSIKITCAPPQNCKGSEGNPSTDGNVLTGGDGTVVVAELYEDKHYGGTKFELKGDIESFPAEFDRKMSSFRIKTGYELRFFEGTNFSGGYYTRRTDVGDFGSAADKIRSVKIMKKPTTGAHGESTTTIATLYDETNYGGDSFALTGDLAVFPEQIDRKMSSAKIASGYQLRFFEGTNYTGGYYTRKGDVKDFSSASNKIRSVKVIQRPSPAAASSNSTVAILYDGENYTGEKFVMTEMVPSFPASFDRKMSSFQVTPGYQIRFFEEPNYQGRYYTRSGSSGSIGSINNKIRSVRIIKGPNVPTPPSVAPSGKK